MLDEKDRRGKGKDCIVEGPYLWTDFVCPIRGYFRLNKHNITFLLDFHSSRKMWERFESRERQYLDTCNYRTRCSSSKLERPSFSFGLFYAFTFIPNIRVPTYLNKSQTLKKKIQRIKVSKIYFLLICCTTSTHLWIILIPSDDTIYFRVGIKRVLVWFG